MSRLLEALRSGNVLLMDGAMGTELIRRGCDVPNDCCEGWNLTRPDAVRAVHLAYLEAGAEVLLTNTFQASPAVLARYSLHDRLGDVWHTAMSAARAFGDVAPLVLADIGPFREDDHQAVDRMLEGCQGADGLLLETWDAHIPLPGALCAANWGPTGSDLPLLISFTYKHTGDFKSLEHAAAYFVSAAELLGAVALGANCGGGIDMDDLLVIARAYRDVTSLPLFIRPNAGTPIRDDLGWIYPYSPEYMADKLWPLLDAGVTMVGGCCGTTPHHIAAFRRVIDQWNAR